jgi:hypothetical protein
MTITPEPMYAKRLRHLRAKTDEELEAEHDALMALGDAVISEDYYRDELARRQAQRATDKIVWLTWAIGAMTLVNTAFVIYSAVK